MTTERWDGKESIVYRPAERPASTLLVMLQCAPAPVRDAPLESAVQTQIVIPQDRPLLRFESAEAYARKSTYDRNEKATADNKVPVYKSGLMF